MTVSDVQPLELLQIVGLCFAAATAVEVLLWLWAFRSDSFRSLRANIDKQARKLEEIRAQPHAPGPQGKAAKQKKIDKLDKTIKMQMAKDLGGVRMKQTFLTAGVLLVLFRMTGKWYGGHVVGKLPFEPFSLLAKLAHRGLESPAANDCSVAFIYALCQAGIRPNVAKFLDWGLSRTMTEMSAIGAQDWANPQAAGKTR
ncbi:hypothetical protein CVIRNUC_001824 [Coccomyxa viridis]|uniref:Calcium load-activated calcium channel n=1 Tax=Coccomyxa viridis TaxID=1274662 RepID=A0AAV1HUE9_9CHLO|nr:hypothetical protein CVIRNUC_001824 [Coccomyxa viridis]